MNVCVDLALVPIMLKFPQEAGRYDLLQAAQECFCFQKRANFLLLVSFVADK